MIFQFKTLDDELFIFDTEEMVWGRASSILSAPSVSAVENRLAKFEFIEKGSLIAMGAGAYSFDGRTPKTGLDDPKNPGPGAGLSNVGILCVPFHDKFIVYLKANIEVKQDSFDLNMPAEAKNFYVTRILPHQTQGR